VKAPIIGLDGQPIGLVGISRDITERKNSGAELYRLNRELRAISNCTQVLIRAVEEKTLLDEICHIVCEEAGYRMAWVGYAENDAEKNVRPIAWAGAEDGYLANCQISWADTERGRGPTGTAIRNSEFVYTQDLANDLCMGPWQEKALQREYCSSIALPLKDKSGIAFGAFTIYSSEINAFTSDEIRLLEELADDLAFGIIVLRDRAKQKQAMVALREAQAVLQIAMDCSPAGIAIADAPDGKLRYVNDAGLLIRGSDRHSVVNGVGIDQYVANWQLLDLDGRQLRTEEVPLARAIMFGETNSRELIIRDADKVDHIVIANAAPIRDESGNVISGIVVFTDITENKQAELALKQSERDLLLMAESMPQIVWITRPDGWNLYFNQQWMDYTGLTLEESMGHDWNKPFHPDDQQRAWNAWENATRNLDTYSLECRLRRADGEYRWWLIRGVPAMDEHGTILKWFGTCTDIDELKKNEDKLLEAKSAAESANRTKSQFLANMSHEIRTPMNGIIAVSQLLQMTELNEEQREYTDLLMTSGKNLLQLITDILDLSRIEAGGVTLEATEFDLSTEMTATVRMFSQLAKAKGLELNLHINPDVPLRLTSDTLRLRQIITNLIGNAIKFTNEGMILLHISKEAEDDQCATLRFSVRDSGIGVSQDNVGKIFESFTQADNSTSIKYGGTGLGLSIARHLTELMGGSVGVESSEGQGSDFWFTAVLQKQTKSLDIPAPETAVQASKTNSINIRILLVEDDEANQVAFSRLLSKSSHQVVIAENGREALRLLEEKDFDLVLMDCRMPLMDGYEATAAIRDQSSKVRNHAIPIIALTANAFREDRQKCLDAGMDDYLSKPIDLAILLEMIEKWVKL
jgi:PAS domain S-box-containing protein